MINQQQREITNQYGYRINIASQKDAKRWQYTLMTLGPFTATVQMIAKKQMFCFVI